MATFKLKLQPGFSTASLTMDVYDAADAFVSTHAATVAQENGTWIATATIDASVPGMADQQITIYVRDLDDNALYVTDSYSIDASGNILPPQSNAGFDAKLDTIISDGAKEATVAAIDNADVLAILGTPVGADLATDIAANLTATQLVDSNLAAHDTSIDSQLSSLAGSIAAIDNADVLAILGTPVNADMSTDIAEVNQGVSAIDVSNIPKVGGGQYYMTITDTTQGAAKAGITLTAI